jgi:hypothetical protein
MATWEDGPEYAPIARPSDFQNPDAPPLKTGAPYEQAAASAPKNRPLFDGPEAPLSPLSSLIPTIREEPRNPQEPFAVVSSTMTSDSAWGAVHWAPPSGRPAGPLQPDQPFAARHGASPMPGPFPTPGTPDWFGPGPYGSQPPAPNPVSARAVLDAATPGLCMCLIIGGLVYTLSPIILCIGIGLSGRVKVARAEVRRAYMFGIGTLAVIGVLGTLVIDTGLADWWAFVGSWGLLICWALLATTLILVYRRLRTDDPNPPPPQSPWR